MPFYSELVTVTVTEAARPDNHNIGKISKVSITFSPKICSGMTVTHRIFLNLNQSIPKSKKQQKNTNVKKKILYKRNCFKSKQMPKELRIPSNKD